MGTLEENVWDPEAHAGDDEVNEGPTEGPALLREKQLISTDVRWQCLVGAEVLLTPVG